MSSASAGQLGRQRRGLDIRGGAVTVGGSVHPERVLPQLTGPTQHQRAGRGEPHRGMRRRCPVEPSEVAFEDLDATGLVAGDRAELDVVRDIGHIGEMRPVEPVGPTVRVPGLFEPSGTQIGPQQGREHALRLFRTGQPAGENSLGQRDRLLVAPLEGEPPRLGRRVTTDAVGQVVAGSGYPLAVPLLGLGQVAHVPGEEVSMGVDRVQAVPALAPPPFHVVQYGPGALQRHLGEPGQTADHVLEVPQQRMNAAPVRHRVAVELGQAPGKGDERLRRLATVHIGRGGEHPRVVRRARAGGGRRRER